ncbi:hypothetical protein AVEN_266927-1 [Araneus ventricosus]|uniref:Uncharacterized protein n=1 Tax=Araneus ventricosus TaxID=182803 RepID=A0A4Y2DEE8_ARAVE|nr:hypothetical protein AVEN_266927-1 [Araneus ventricosus]
MLGLVILTSRFEATRGLFWDGPRNCEPRSDTELASPLQTSTAHQRITADLQWNQISNPELPGPKPETLPLGHRDLGQGFRAGELQV